MAFRTGLAKLPKILLGLGSFVCVCFPAQANEVYVSADSYEYMPDIGDFNLDFAPLGAALGGSLDITDALSLQAEFGQWKDDQKLTRMSTANFKSNLVSLGAEYSVNSWTLNAIYTDVKDEIDVIHGNQLEFHSKSDANLMTLLFSAAYEKKIEDWALYLEGGVQFDKADTDAMFDQENLLVDQKDEALFGMLKVGGDYYIPTGEQSAFFIGGNLSWYQEMYSDTDTIETNIGGGIVGGSKRTPRRPPPGTGGGTNGPGTNINRTLGDSFGILGVYTTYQINDSWSLDWTSTFGFSGEKNANSHALTLSFSF